MVLQNYGDAKRVYASIMECKLQVNTPVAKGNLSCNMKKTTKNGTSGFPTRSDTNWPLQLQKKARSLKF